MATTLTSKSNQTKEEIKPWVRIFGRFGYMTKGTVYFLIGILTFMGVVGIGGKTTGTSGLFRSVANVKFGEVLLWILGTGLIGYAIWVFIESLADPKRQGSSVKGIIVRIGYFASGIIYGALAVNAIKIAIKAGSRSGNSEQTLSAKLLSQPFGAWLVCFVGVIIIGYGIYELYQGSTGNFIKRLHIGDMDEKEVKTAKKAGKYGLSARGIVLGIIGYFFIRTALTSNPYQAKGLDGALSELSQQPYGQWLLGIAAIGLVLYGVYQIVRGRYTRMNFGKGE